MQNFYVYIDEAGDEGFGKLADTDNKGQSRWLVLGACIVREQNDKLLPAWRNEILSKFPRKQKRDLHFRDLSHEQKVVACQILGVKPLGFCGVFSNKITINDHPKRDVFRKNKGYLYNYLIRYLLERVSYTCSSASEKDSTEKPQLHITFSRRGGTNYSTMQDYLKLLRDGKEKIKPVRTIDWNIIDINSIKVEDHASRAGLQIADVFTSAFFMGFEGNHFGNYEHQYGEHLAKRIISKNNQIIDWGLTLIPKIEKNPLNEQQRAFLSKIYIKRSG